MSLTDKIYVLELLMGLLYEHENQLDSIIEKMEIIEQTIAKDSSLRKSVKEYDPTRQIKSIIKNILIVDDDISLSNSFKLILESVGHSVDTAHTGLHAFYSINKKDYDLILLDLVLPDMNGENVAKEIEAHHKHIDIVYITGYSELKPDDDKEILIKPIKPEHLLDTASNNHYKI